MHFVDTNTVILKKKISTKLCLYVPKNNFNCELLSHFLQVSNLVLH